MYNFNVFYSDKQNQKMSERNAEKRFGQAYVPQQRFEYLYNLQQALKSGTVFAQLETPFAKNHYNRK